MTKALHPVSNNLPVTRGISRHNYLPIFITVILQFFLRKTLTGCTLDKDDM